MGNDGVAVLGRTLLGIGVAALGMTCLIFGAGVYGLEPLPAWLPAGFVWALASGIWLAVTGLAMAAGIRVRMAAVALAVLLLSWLLGLLWTDLLLHPGDGDAWTCAFETLAMFGATLALAANAPHDTSLPTALQRLSARSAAVGRTCFALSLPVFGVLHFVYHDYVASVIPAWIPAHMFFAYFTGVAHFAAGVAILFRVKARLAALLAGTMYGTWALILHIPRALTHLHQQPEWTSLCIAVTLSGAAFVVAGGIGRRVAP